MIVISISNWLLPINFMELNMKNEYYQKQKNRNTNTTKQNNNKQKYISAVVNGINRSGAETGTFCDNKVNTMVADFLVNGKY